MRVTLTLEVDDSAAGHDPSRWEDAEQYVRGAIEVGDDAGAISVLSVDVGAEEAGGDLELELPDLDDELGLEED